MGCSIKKIAVNKLGDALAGGGTTFSSDDDPELIKSAVPFSLKLMESLLAESPKHPGLLFATSSGFTQYAYAFVQQEADEAEDQDLERASQLRDRAQRLYLRARNYGLRGLALRQVGVEKTLRENPVQTVKVFKPADVPLLYWTAVAWGSLIALSKDNPDVIADQPVIEALIDRALELDPNYGEGSIHSFLINYEMVRQGGEGSAEDRSRHHFQRAVDLSKGKQAGPYVALAEAVSLKKQNRNEFEQLLNQALAINPDDETKVRLVNLVMQRRARWLLSKQDDLFLK